jgi:hypothetical protein
VATTDDFVARAAESAEDPVVVEALLNRWLRRRALPPLPAARPDAETSSRAGRGARSEPADEPDSAESA